MKKRTKQRVAVPLSKGVYLDNLGIQLALISRNLLNIRWQTLIKSEGFLFLRVKGVKLKVLCNRHNIIQLRSAVPFSKAIAKGCIPEIEGMQPFSVYALIFNELRSP